MIDTSFTGWPDGVGLYCEIHPYTLKRLHPPDEYGRETVFFKIDGSNASVSVALGDAVEMRELTASVRASAELLRKYRL